MELKYIESQYLNPEVFDHLQCLYFFPMVFENEWARVWTWYKVLVIASVLTEMSVTICAYMRISICIWPSIWRYTSAQPPQLILIIIIVNLLQINVVIGEFYPSHFNVAEIVSIIFNAMASHQTKFLENYVYPRNSRTICGPELNLWNWIFPE